MLQRLMLAFTVLGASIALAGTPLGSDDGGQIPSDAPKGPVAKCENGVGKSVAKLVAATIKCHGGRASGKFADDTSEDACEGAALTKFGATKTTGCPSCINLTTIGAAVVALVDTNNNKVYCSSAGGAFGGDDTGVIPTDAPKGPITKCENGVGKAVGKLVAAIGKCHASRVTGKLADDASEESCEGAALTKFGATKTVGCTSCTELTSLGSFVESTVDGANGLTYCGSPSAAFLE